MKVLHVPYSYFPDPPGGTEVYVEALARYQRESGMEPAIAAPAGEDGIYEHEGSPVYRFRMSKALRLRELYGLGDPEAAQSFSEVLERARPDVAHFHAFTSAISTKVLRSAREAGIPVIFTYHTPSVTCLRGTLLRWGSEQCDGRMEFRKCAACAMHGAGVPKAASWALGCVPSGFGAFLGARDLEGGAWTALRATELSTIRHRAARELFAETDAVIAVCEWVRQTLIRNGVENDKIVLCRQGLRRDLPKGAGRPKAPESGPLRIAFLGRLDAVKGLSVLIDAIALVPALRLTLDIFGVTQNEGNRRFRETLIERSRGDRRIRFLPPLDAGSIVEKLCEYDAVAVPSQWMESGPLVVYEAFAAGTPVIGSKLGGVAELVQDGVNGLLIEPASRMAWANGLKRLVEEPELLEKLRNGIGPVRTMRHVFSEMQTIYQREHGRAGYGRRLQLTSRQ